MLRAWIRIKWIFYRLCVSFNLVRDEVVAEISAMCRFYSKVFFLQQYKGEICGSVYLYLTKPIYKLGAKATIVNFLITNLPCADNP